MRENADQKNYECGHFWRGAAISTRLYIKTYIAIFLELYFFSAQETMLVGKFDTVSYIAYNFEQLEGRMSCVTLPTLSVSLHRILILY